MLRRHGKKILLILLSLVLISTMIGMLFGAYAFTGTR